MGTKDTTRASPPRAVFGLDLLTEVTQISARGGESIGSRTGAVMDERE